MNTEKMAKQYTDDNGKLNFPSVATIVRFVKSSGSRFFDPDTMQYWGTTVLDKVYGGCYFITHETGFATSTTPNGRYVLRMVKPNGFTETIDHGLYLAEMQALVEKICNGENNNENC